MNLIDHGSAEFVHQVCGTNGVREQTGSGLAFQHRLGLQVLTFFYGRSSVLYVGQMEQDAVLGLICFSIQRES